MDLTFSQQLRHRRAAQHGIYHGLRHSCGIVYYTRNASAPLTEDLGGTLQTVVHGHDWHHVPSRLCLLGAIVTTLQHDSITVRVFDKYSRRTGVPAASYLTLPQAHRPPLNIDHHASLFVVNQEDQVTSTASVRAAKPKILSIFVGYCPFLLLLSRRAIHRSLQVSALWQTPQDARC
ncbi:hypothetical protein CGCSCA5_v003437 [Colletotrichum siamense]|nr:hypothetical protein CGCSCA5_v003437 [Colletotrichum siamense]